LVNLFRLQLPQPWRSAQIETLLAQLFKIGARVRQTARCIRIHLATGWPFQSLFRGAGFPHRLTCSASPNPLTNSCPGGALSKKSTPGSTGLAERTGRGGGIGLQNFLQYVRPSRHWVIAITALVIPTIVKRIEVS
jgi:hypothetical protein